MSENRGIWIICSYIESYPFEKGRQESEDRSQEGKSAVFAPVFRIERCLLSGRLEAPNG